VKRSLLVEGQGGPLAAVVVAANVPDVQVLGATLDAVVIPRPDPEQDEQHLCLDKGYDSDDGWGEALEHGYAPHIAQVHDSRPVPPQRRHPPKRWVAERTLAWLSKCRAILIRYDKRPENYFGLIQLACALLWFRRLDVLR